MKSFKSFKSFKNFNQLRDFKKHNLLDTPNIQAQMLGGYYITASPVIALEESFRKE